MGLGLHRQPGRKEASFSLEALSRSVKSSSGTKRKCGKAAFSLSAGALQGPPPENDASFRPGWRRRLLNIKQPELIRSGCFFFHHL